MSPPPQTVCDATASWAQSYAPKGGRPTKRGHEVVVVESEERFPPPPPRVKPPRSPPSHHSGQGALDVGALAAIVATHVTDACHTLVEQATVTGVEAALANGRAAEQRWALSRAEKVQGNTQRALDRALVMANKGGGGVEAVRGDLKEAEEGRQEAEVKAAQLRVEMEALRRTRDDLRRRQGVPQAQVRSLTSTLSGNYTAPQRVGPLGVQSQGSGNKSGSQ